ncbi:hypothetical protein HY991_03190 [Candidatus Micrarchaeota archaeon]|nr:hypothetical protein [Candidatus Micrarchaeota archaeon]
MEENEKEFLVHKIRDLKDHFAKGDIASLKSSGGDFAELAFLRQEKELVDFSIVAYSLAKFLEKPYILESSEWKDFSLKTAHDLEQCAIHLEHDQLKEYTEQLSAIISEINKISFYLGRFTTSVVEKARIKAGAQMYAHGASLGKAAYLSGAEKDELAKYISETRLPEKYLSLSLAERLKKAEELFES